MFSLFSLRKSANNDPSVPSTVENALCLTDLNDDCLTEILGYVTNIDDLCSVAATCSRLNAIAFDTWDRHHKNQSLKFERIMRKYGANAKAQIVSYLMSFGELLTSIEFTLTDDVEWQQTSQVSYEQALWNDVIFDKIVQHCADTLQSLTMRGIALSVPRTSPGQAVFMHLKKLKLDYCVDLKCYEYASKLHVDWYFNKAFVFVRHLAGTGTLEHLEISQMLLTKEFLMILCECQNLKVLKLNAIRDGNFCGEEAFAEWLQNLKHIVELEFIIEYCDVGALNSLSVFLNHIGSAATVEQLHICGGEADQEFVRGMQRFQRLRKLTIGYFNNLTVAHMQSLDNLGDVVEFTMTTWNQLTPEDLVVVVGKMPRLETLRLHMAEYEEIDDDTFVRLATICRARNRRLVVEHTEQVLTWNIDPEIFDSHSNILSFRPVYL